MYKVLIYGFDDVYAKNHIAIEREVFKGNIKIVAISGGDHKLHKRTLMDGIPVIPQKDIVRHSFDYMVICNGAFAKIKQSFINQGIPENIIVDGTVFSLFNFDFARYVELLKNPLTVFSDDCWGG